MSKEITFGMIKPEGLERSLEDEFYKRIIWEDLMIIQKSKRALTTEEVEYIYGHLKEKLPEIYLQTQRDLTTKNVMLLKIEGDRAVEKLQCIRGASNACDAAEGTIRGDYAKDQDYIELRNKGKRALNYFHAADTEEEARRMISLLLEKDV